MPTKTTQSKTQNIPKFRFPGFLGDWKLGRLGDVGEIIGGGTPDTTKEKYWNGEINWFTPTEIKSKYAKYSLRKITDIGLKNSSAKLLPIGTILFTSRATVGDLSISAIECSTNQGFQSIIANNQNSNEFIYYWVKKNRNEFLRKANGSTFLEVSSKEMKKIKNIFPLLPEQQKISGFLGTTDELINNLKEQKGNLESYKKGMMQKIFSQEIRFKDEKGKEFPEWENVAIKDCFSFKQGVQISIESQFISKNTDKIRFIRIIDITQNNETPRYIKDPGVVHHVSLNDLFMVRYGIPGLISIGYEGVIANNLFRLIPKNDSKINTKFYYFKFKQLEKSILELSGSSSMPAISFSTLSSIRLPLPSLFEQQKIADFLTSIDKVIESKQNQITEVEQWKKGLMQGLFV